MIPNFTIGSKTLSAYIICALIGIFVAGIFAIKTAIEDDRLEYTTALLWGAPGVIVGGGLLFAVTKTGYIIEAFKSGEKLMTILQNGFGGIVFYGGMIGGLISGYLYCRYAKIDIKKYIDSTAMFIPLFHVFGRIGCFLSGCCFGVESSVGFVYKYSPMEIANHVRRFPIQLAEAAGNLIIFLIIFYLFRKKALEKKLLSLYFVMYPVLRFNTEFFRGDDYRGFLGPLSTSQIISLILFCVGVAGLFMKRPDDVSAETEEVAQE